MSPLQFILSFVTVVFILFGIDLFQRRKFNFLHFLVFVGGGAASLFFIFNSEYLDKFGKYFGAARGADLVIYSGLIVLIYFYFELLHKVTKQQINFTRLVTELGVQNNDELTKLKSIPDSQNFKDHIAFAMRAYNEGASIGAVIDDVIQAGFSKIVIVSDGSKDNTEEVVRKKQEQHPTKNIFFFHHPINRGGGAANKTLFSFFSKYGSQLKVDRVVTYDADGQMDIKDMEVFIQTLQKNPNKEIFLGSRFIEGGTRKNMPALRKIVLRGSTLVTYIFNRVWLSDPHNGYRVIKLSALTKIRLESDGMAYANDLVDEIRKNKIPYMEVPVNIRYTDYSLSKGQKNSNAFKILFELIYKKLFFK